MGRTRYSRGGGDEHVVHICAVLLDQCVCLIKAGHNHSNSPGANYSFLSLIGSLLILGPILYLFSVHLVLRARREWAICKLHNACRS